MKHVLIMGRKTYQSIGKPLPGRVSLVLSKNPIPDARNSFWNLNETTVFWVNNRETALYYADVLSCSRSQDEFFVIGGEQMYRAFNDLFNKIHITEVLTGKNPEGDARFNFSFDQRKWKSLYNEDVPQGPHDDFPSNYSILERRTKTVRYVDIPDYYTDSESRRQWVAAQIEKLKSIPSGVMEKKAKEHQYILEFEST